MRVLIESILDHSPEANQSIHWYETQRMHTNKTYKCIHTGGREQLGPQSHVCMYVYSLRYETQRMHTNKTYICIHTGGREQLGPQSKGKSEYTLV